MIACHRRLLFLLVHAMEILYVNTSKKHRRFFFSKIRCIDTVNVYNFDVSIHRNINVQKIVPISNMNTQYTR